MKFKKRKATKMRASTFHGWGRGASHHKGSGNRGGKGRAGSGKKADGKKPSFWKEPQGKHGFGSKRRISLNAINIEQVILNLHDWESKGFVSKKGAGFEVDLPRTGYTKLLGTGVPRFALHIKTDFASANAVEKVKAAGGEVTVLKTIVKKEKKKPVQHKKKQEEEGEADSE